MLPNPQGMVMRRPEDQTGTRAKKCDVRTAEQAYAIAAMCDADHPIHKLSSERYVLFMERHFDARGRRRAEPLEVALQVPSTQLAALDATVTAYFQRHAVPVVELEGLP